MQTKPPVLIAFMYVLAKRLRLVGVALLLLMLCGCATTPTTQTVTPSVVVKQVDGHSTYYFGA